jgi:hypothetical protein
MPELLKMYNVKPDEQTPVFLPANPPPIPFAIGPPRK